ncbi:NlpC/P60 family protein [Heyndrickxia camelliae]|uniref:NlpC/P60 family protein n=2 Tax=Heyndrickxia camelliae TaxID=1707093 RepID=A0A2N3LLP1_9BACI|nr:NlpC/P60 family protein [Heyndrickxia camelliae]
MMKMKAERIINTGYKFIGVPYIFNAPPFRTDMFDCSSFIQYIFMVHGIILPRNSRQQSMAGRRVSLKQIRKGDLLFFTTKDRKHKNGISKIGHVALYIGKGRMLHTYRPENRVTITEIDKKWISKFVMARRIL